MPVAASAISYTYLKSHFSSLYTSFARGTDSAILLSPASTKPAINVVKNRMHFAQLSWTGMMSVLREVETMCRRAILHVW